MSPGKGTWCLDPIGTTCYMDPCLVPDFIFIPGWWLDQICLQRRIRCLRSSLGWVLSSYQMLWVRMPMNFE